MGPSICRRDAADFGHAFSNCTDVHLCMWPILVEFRSARWEIRRRKERRRKKEESLVKCKSVDRYVGRPNNKIERLNSGSFLMRPYINEEKIERCLSMIDFVAYSCLKISA